MRVLLAAAFCLLPLLVRADDAAAYQKCAAVVVGVIGTAPDGTGSRGTGVVVAPTLIVTANHVIEAAAAVEVIFPERDGTGVIIGNPAYYAGRGKRCRVVGADRSRDLAMLQVLVATDADLQKAKSEPYVALSMGAKPGEQVFTIGAGSGAFWHYASGNVRQVYRAEYETAGGKVQGQFVEMTIPVNPGNSGGPILDKDGHLVGIILATVPGKNQIHLGMNGSEVVSFITDTLEAELRRLNKTGE